MCSCRWKGPQEAIHADAELSESVADSSRCGHEGGHRVVGGGHPGEQPCVDGRYDCNVDESSVCRVLDEEVPNAAEEPSNAVRRHDVELPLYVSSCREENGVGSSIELASL